MKSFALLGCIFFTLATYSQQAATYLDSLQQFRNHYIETHEVVKAPNRQYLQFYTIDPAYRLQAKLERLSSSHWFSMNTSGKVKQAFRKYGKLTFTLLGKPLQLFVYQSQDLMRSKEYANYLFVPFTDSSSWLESYNGGRYMDFMVSDIKGSLLEIDFNKAYNPYCAYSTGYSCPIPPNENDLAVAIQAGEKNYAFKRQ